MKNTTLVQYIYHRNKSRGMKGVMVAVPRPSPIGGYDLGFSLCRKGRGGDKFNKNIGKKIAIERAMRGDNSPTPVSIVEEFGKFIQRCERYFHDI